MDQQLLREPTRVGPDPPRVPALSELDPAARGRIDRLVGLSTRGLTAAYLPRTGGFARTVRGLPGGAGVRVVHEGTDLRYAAIAALGLGRLPVAAQREVVDGRTARDVAALVVERADRTPDLGAVALAVWAASEVYDELPHHLLTRLGAAVASPAPIPALDLAWSLTAGVAAARFGDTEELLATAAARLVREQGVSGLWAHVLPARTQPRWRAHVGSFADQVYPLQALARAARLTGSTDLLAAAERTATRICRLQGPAGQWWWHYDARDGGIVERYPVYSVHQHAMAPMALLDLWEAGGSDHRAEVASGLAWLDHHPEVVEELVSDRFGLVWRKVGRREPPKAARGIGALTTALRPGLHAPGIDTLLPPSVVDHECRPYELGWLLYAWLPPRPDSRAGGASDE
ncbi:hypothetical protein ACT8ZV_09595 [Nocardioides sp. MAHUQ-72]|uniref:hypothetical protein n=1 Tax=unclassified Nocardioides TaxID=2615069 RepID=UPI00361E5804